MKWIESGLERFAGLAWGPWLLVLLLGGGFYFLLYSRFIPFRYFYHGVEILLGRFDRQEDPGDLSHFQALSSALAGTIGMGNIAGVAVAISVGGPGSIFWMWVGAFLGIATKFFTCSLAVMYRGRDSAGHLQGGPMYVVVEGLGKRWRPLGIWFAVCGLVAALPALQANQLVQAVREVVVFREGVTGSFGAILAVNLICGTAVAIFVGWVIAGGIQRLGAATSKMVPAMVVLYLGMALWVLVLNGSRIGEIFGLIFSSAFSGDSVAGGGLGWVILTGVKRSAFSNEAGIGTEAMAHGAAKTREPIREGLVAMLGPVVDTLLVCSATAFIILSSSIWKTGEISGVTLTARALEEHLPGVGGIGLMLCVLFFSLSTMLSYSYYGTKCLGFLIGAERQGVYQYFYLASILMGSVMTLSAAINLIDGMFALMAIPTMVSALLLSPKVMAEAKRYFASLDSKR